MRKLSVIALLSLVLASSVAAEELAIGAKGPDFKLMGTDGEKHALDEYVAEAKATVVVFTCNTCPFSKAYEPVLLEMAATYAEKPVEFVLINSNSVKLKPGDSFDEMVKLAKEKEYPFDYLYDETQKVARAYGAERTPHVFVLDAKKNCIYRGRINDNAKPDEVTAHDLAAAIDATLAGKEVPTAVTKAFGCTIKWDKKSS